MISKNYNINADLGEGYNIEKAIMPYLNSCNIACGGHFGDVNSIKKVVSLALKYKVKIGAHPSYPDKVNFGREELSLSTSELHESISNQIKLMLEVVPEETLHHVKPHGALYHSCANDIKTATLFLNVIELLCPKAIVFTLPNSALEKQALKKGIKVWREAFIDRAYQNDGQLVPRSQTGAVLNDREAMYNQFYFLSQKHSVQTITKSWIDLKPDTLCVHGDHPNSVSNLKFILDHFKQKNKHIE